MENEKLKILAYEYVKARNRAERREKNNRTRIKNRVAQAGIKLGEAQKIAKKSVREQARRNSASIKKLEQMVNELMEGK